MATSPSRGRFITLEGIEGAGKSTVAQLVSEWLGSRGITARVTREPGGTPLAERVRKIVLDRGDEAVSPRAETLLMFAARSIHVENLIRPALARGEWVIVRSVYRCVSRLPGLRTRHGSGLDRESR